MSWCGGLVGMREDVRGLMGIRRIFLARLALKNPLHQIQASKRSQKLG